MPESATPRAKRRPTWDPELRKLPVPGKGLRPDPAGPRVKATIQQAQAGNEEAQKYLEKWKIPWAAAEEAAPEGGDTDEGRLLSELDTSGTAKVGHFKPSLRNRAFGNLHTSRPGG